MAVKNNLKPISIWTVISIFMLTLIPILAGVYLILPFLLSKGLSFFAGYLLCFQTVPFILILIFALYLYKTEGNELTFAAFKNRMRLNYNVKVLLAGILLFSLGLTTYLVLQPVTLLLAKSQLFAPPDWFAPDINPLKHSDSGAFMGVSMKGLYWVPFVYFIGWVFNIAGEELLFRGYLMPRMELSFNKYTWIINGSCWLLWHCFWRWQLIALLPFAFLLPFIAQKTKSTIPGMIAHGIMNFVPVLIILIKVR